MISKNQIKLLQSLKIKKYRIQHNNFIAEGPKLAQDIIHSDLQVIEVYALESWLKNNARLIEDRNLDTYMVTEKELERISFMKSPSEVLLRISIPKLSKYISHTGYALLLDRINDPGNLGTIIRTADWFGIDHIILSEDCADPFNPKTVQSSMGSIGRVKLFKENLETICRETKMPCYAAELGGEHMAKTTFAENGMLIIGSESHGIDPDILALASQKIKIEGRGYAESLNAAIATGIICYQIMTR